MPSQTEPRHWPVHRSIPQPENVREDVVRIDHIINQKSQLMGHFLHDSMSSTLFPPLCSSSTYPMVGTTMENPFYTAVIRLTQTYSPNFLTETSFLYGGSTIRLTPSAGQGGSIEIPAGWMANSFFPIENNAGQTCPRSISKAHLSARCRPKLTSSGRTATKALNTVTTSHGTKAATSSSSASIGPRLQKPATAGQHTNYQGVDRASHDANFGQVTSDYGPRLLELGGKLIF